MDDLKMLYRVIEFIEKIYRDKDKNSVELENNLNGSMKLKLDLNRNGYKKSVNN